MIWEFTGVSDLVSISHYCVCANKTLCYMTQVFRVERKLLKVKRETVYNPQEYIFFLPFSFILAQQLPPPVGQGLCIHDVARSHTTTHHSQQDSSGRGISSSQRPRRDNTRHSQQIPMPSVGFEPTISASQRPQTHALDRAATGTGTRVSMNEKSKVFNPWK